MGLMEQILLPSAVGNLSALLGEPGEPARGTVVALHGGGTRAAYWDAPHSPRSSFARAAVADGWRVLAVDRPGYGASADAARLRLRAGEQAEIVRDAVLAQVGDEPVALIAHSLGSIVAAYCGADGWAGRLTALALHGVPLAYLDSQLATFAGVDASGPTVRHPGGGASLPLEVWFGPAGTWDRSVLDHFSIIMARTPSGEFEDAKMAPQLLAQLLPSSRVPVQLCVGEHEQSTAPTAMILDRAHQLLIGVAGSTVLVIPGAAHNISLGGAAQSYHQLVLDHLAACVPRIPER